MIDAVDLLLIENVKDNLIQFPGGSQVASERFLNDDAHPRIGRGGSRETCAAELLDDVRINFRRRGKIKETVASDILRRFQFGEAFGELSISIRIRIIAGTVIKVGSEIVPLLGIDGPDFGDALGRFAQGGSKGVLGHGGARKADDGITRPEPIVNREVVHRGNDFAFGEISRGTEENHRAGLRHSTVN